MDGSDTTQQSAFRRFSHSLYGRDGVEEACLTLQDEHDLDVNILLLCCWVGGHGVRLSQEALQQLDQALAPWRETTLEPIRNVRRRLKQSVGGFDPATTHTLREEVKAVELRAETLAQDHLIAVLEHVTGKDGRDADRNGLVRGNLLRYFRLNAGTEITPRDQIEALVSATFPDGDEE